MKNYPNIEKLPGKRHYTGYDKGGNVWHITKNDSGMWVAIRRADGSRFVERSMDGISSQLSILTGPGTALRNPKMKTIRARRNPLKLRPVGSNMTELLISVPEFRGDTKILFSYQTPVAAMNLSPEWHEKFGAACIKTSKKWSVTTSKHITKWLQGAKATPVEQSVLDEIVQKNPKTVKHSRRNLRTRIKQFSLDSGLGYPREALKRATRHKQIRAKKNPRLRSMKTFMQRTNKMLKKRASRHPNLPQHLFPEFKRAITKRQRQEKKTAARKHRAVNRVLRAKKNPIVTYLLQLVRRNGSRWYLHKSAQTLTDNRAHALHFASEKTAMDKARQLRDALARTGIVRATTIVA